MKNLIPLIVIFILLLPLILCVIAFFLPLIVIILIISMFSVSSRAYFSDLKRRRFSFCQKENNKKSDTSDDVIDVKCKVISSEPCDKR